MYLFCISANKYIYIYIYAENAYLRSFERHTGMGQKEETDTKVNPLVEYWDCFSKIHCLGTPQCFDPCLRTHCVFLFVFLFFLSWEGWNLCGGTSTGTYWGKTTGCSASGPAGRG